MNEKMECSITDSNIQEPDDAVDYERQDEDEAYDRDRQQAHDDKRAETVDLRNRSDDAFIKWYMKRNIPSVSEETLLFLQSAFYEGCKFGVNELYREATKQ